MTNFKRPSSADVTPVDESAVPPLREEIAQAKRELSGTQLQIAETKKEITNLHQLSEMLETNQSTLLAQQRSVVDKLNGISAAMGPIVDMTQELESTITRIVAGQIERLHAELLRERATAIKAYDRKVDEKLARAFSIERAARSAADEALALRVDGVDSGLAELGLKLASEFAGIDRDREEVTGVTNVLVQRVDKHESFIEKHEKTIVAAAGSSGLTIAVSHVAPLVWSAAKNYAVSKGWIK